MAVTSCVAERVALSESDMRCITFMYMVLCKDDDVNKYTPCGILSWGTLLCSDPSFHSLGILLRTQWA